MPIDQKVLDFVHKNLVATDSEVIKPYAEYTYTRDLPIKNDLSKVVRAVIQTRITGGAGQGTQAMTGRSWVNLKANDLKTFYWMPDEGSGRGEVDFVLQTRSAEVIPIEVKSARNVSAKSLRKLMCEGSSPYAIRLSEQQFGRSAGEDGTELRSLPLYAAFCIEAGGLG